MEYVLLGSVASLGGTYVICSIAELLLGVCDHPRPGDRLISAQASGEAARAVHPRRGRP
jgi:hypothetical protein